MKFGLAVTLLCVCAWLVAVNATVGLWTVAVVLMIMVLARKRENLERVLREIGLLEEHLHELGAGNLGVEPPAIQSREVGKLQNAVDGMTRQIHSTVEDLQEAVHRDPLTGLPNRSAFKSSVERQLLADGEQEKSGCLFFIDVDDFKSINDSLGHNIGDQLLRIAADRLRLAVRLSDQIEAGIAQSADSSEVQNIARFGGDEFTIFLPGISEGTARKVAARLQRVLSETYELGSHAVSTSASIGAALAPCDGTNHDQLLRAADAAMYHAKRQKAGKPEFYCSALDEELRRVAEREQELSHALANEEFEIHFQPLFDCQTLKITSAEALIRWNHPTRGLIHPAESLRWPKRPTSSSKSVNG